MFGSISVAVILSVNSVFHQLEELYADSNIKLHGGLTKGFHFLGISSLCSVNKSCGFMFRQPLLKVNQSCKQDINTRRVK